jgi:GT2 family glycosyltransferase
MSDTTAPINPGQTFVLIPTHNRRDILCATLVKVRKQLPTDSARLIVVDAGSSDGTSMAVQTLCPSAEIVQGDPNMWWAATVNHGLSYIASTARGGDRIILMNDDVDLDPLAMQSLLEASLLEPRSVIGAVNVTQRPGEEPRVYFCGGRYDLWLARHKANILPGTRWHNSMQRFFETDYLYGRLLIIPWEAFESGCRFDAQTFPQYCADEDFAFDAKRRGFRPLIDSNAIVYVNTETTARFSLSLSNGLCLVWKALTADNSCYNWKQGWAFARRYSRWPIVFMLCRYSILALNENFRRLKSSS